MSGTRMGLKLSSANNVMNLTQNFDTVPTPTLAEARTCRTDILYS